VLLLINLIQTKEIMNKFYNTIGIPQDLLIIELEKVKKQQEKVITIFKVSMMLGLTPTEVYKALGEQYPITSIRRSITNLTEYGTLRKTDKMRKGMYGKMNHVWELKEK
jgi:hypothetical protein